MASNNIMDHASVVYSTALRLAAKHGWGKLVEAHVKNGVTALKFQSGVLVAAHAKKGIVVERPATRTRIA